MLSFDTSETMYVEWSKSNVTEQVTSVTINDSLKENDFLLVTHIQDNEESDKNNVSLDNIGNTKYITSENYIPKLTLFKINENANIANIKFATATEYAIILLRFNTALRPENIRANIKIMDIIGNLSEDDMSKIKYFKSVSELNASTDNKEGDFAAVIDDNDNFIGFYKYENEQWEKQTVDTDDATAAATDIANGKTAYAKGEKVTGIVPVITGLTSDYVPSEGVGKYGSYIYGLAKPAGRNNMQTTMYRAASTLNVLLPQNSIATVSGLTADVLKKDTKVLGIIGNYEGTVTSDADATAGDIMEGKTAYVKGEKITGTVAPISSINMGNAKSAYVPTEDLTSLILNTTITDRGILGQNIDYQIKANGSQITNAVGLTPEILKKNNQHINLDTLLDRDCIGGYDLSDTEDFTSACLEFPLDDGGVFILEHSWIPHRRYEQDKNPERIRMWEKQGEITIIPGDYVDFSYVYDWFKDMSEKYNIVQINYDPAKAIRLNKQMEEFGFKTQPVRQGFFTLGGPMQNFKELLLDGKVVFNEQSMFKWYLNNVELITDRNDNWMPTKSSRSRKIDGFAAALDAHVSVIDMLVEPDDGEEPISQFISFR